MMRRFPPGLVLAGAIALLTACTGAAPGPRVAPSSSQQQVASSVAGEPAPQPTRDHRACRRKSLADVDGDGRADTLVGVPSHGAGPSGPAGAVDVHGTASGARLLTPADLGPIALDAGGDGAAIAMTDLDNDGCVDAVIGAPGEQPDAAAGGAPGPGQAYVVFGSPHGLDPGTAVRLPALAGAVLR